MLHQITLHGCKQTSVYSVVQQSRCPVAELSSCPVVQLSGSPLWQPPSAKGSGQAALVSCPVVLLYSLHRQPRVLFSSCRVGEWSGIGHPRPVVQLSSCPGIVLTSAIVISIFVIIIIGIIVGIILATSTITIIFAIVIIVFAIFPSACMGAHMCGVAVRDQNRSTKAHPSAQPAG